MNEPYVPMAEEEELHRHLDLERMLLGAVEAGHEVTPFDIEQLVGLITKRAWWLRGASAYHEGVAPGMGGEGWTREEATAWNNGWGAAALRGGGRRVGLEDCGPDFDDCEHCSQQVGEWHMPGCTLGVNEGPSDAAVSLLKQLEARSEAIDPAEGV